MREYKRRCYGFENVGIRFLFVFMILEKHRNIFISNRNRCCFSHDCHHCYFSFRWVIMAWLENHDIDVYTFYQLLQAHLSRKSLRFLYKIRDRALFICFLLPSPDSRSTSIRVCEEIAVRFRTLGDALSNELLTYTPVSHKKCEIRTSSSDVSRSCLRCRPRWLFSL